MEVLAAIAKGVKDIPYAPTQVSGLLKGLFVFMGAPGVGKGTFATILGPALGLKVVTAGDLLRAEVAKGGKTAEELRSLMLAGRLVPDPLIVGLIKQATATLPPDAKGVLLDGFPRTVPQAEALEAHTPPALVVNILLKEEVAVAKMLGRRTCPICKIAFNAAEVMTDGFDMPAQPPPPPGECSKGPICPVWSREDWEVALPARLDDNAEVVRKRLGHYRQTSEAVLEYYRSKGSLVDFRVLKGVKDAPRLAREMEEGVKRRRGGGEGGL